MIFLVFNAAIRWLYISLKPLAKSYTFFQKYCQIIATFRLIYQSNHEYKTSQFFKKTKFTFLKSIFILKHQLNRS